MDSNVFSSTHSWNPERIHALALYCSDGRWGEAFDEFCHEGLGLPRYDRFAVPGGPLCLSMRDARLLDAYSTAREQIHFLVEAHQLDRLILITHYGCAAYASLLGEDADAYLPAQEDDLRTVGRTLRGWFAGVRLESYVAMRRESRIWFRPVEL